MIHLVLIDHHDAPRIVDALRTAADTESTARPFVARRYRLLADQLGDAIDSSALPTWTTDPLDPKPDTQETP